MSKRFISRRRALLLGASGLAAAPILAATATPAFADKTSTAVLPKVYIDPGHGGSDPGAVGYGLREKDLTLAISLAVREHLNANWNLDIRMSRTTDIDRTLAYRTDEANAWGADVFVSIHINAAGGTGFESFRHTNASAGAIALQNAMHPKILAAMSTVNPVVDRGKKSYNFHVLRESTMPAILTENLFIDRAEDAALLKNPAFLDATAIGHAEGIAQFLGLIGGDPDPTPEPVWPVLQLGAYGENVRTLQYLVREEGQDIVVDGDFGPATDSAVRAIQEELGLVVDGVAGEQTWTATVVTRKNGDEGEAVKGIQRSLSSKHGIATVVDGDFGPGTDDSVRTFQDRRNLVVDGVVGPITWLHLVG